MKRPLLTIEEAAEMLGVSLRTAYTLARERRLAGAIKVGNQWRVVSEKLEEWVWWNSLSEEEKRQVEEEKRRVEEEKRRERRNERRRERRRIATEKRKAEEEKRRVEEEKRRKIAEGRRPSMGKWSRSIRERDNFTCQKCGVSGEKEILHAHHIIPVKVCPEKALDLDNGTTLCISCHWEWHRQNPMADLIAKYSENQSMAPAPITSGDGSLWFLSEGE